MLHQFHLDRFEEWFIVSKAHQLAGKAGFTVDDVEDIQQDIRLDILKRLPGFDPAKSNRHTFIVMVVRRCVASMLERQGADKRNKGRRPQSLNTPISDEQDQVVELSDTIDAGTVRPGRSRQELADLAADVRTVVNRLPGDLQAWCGVLSRMGIRETSRELGVSRTRLQRIVREIRAAFERAGLRDYMFEK